MKKIRRQKSRRKKNATLKKIGLPPGTMIHDGEIIVEKPEIHVTEYNSENVNVHLISSAAELEPLLEVNGYITWAKFIGLHDIKTIGDSGSHLGIHPLVLEDIVNTSQRPKVEHYDDYLFVVVRHMTLNSESGELENHQISLILSKDCVISYHERQDELFDTLRPRIDIPNGRFRRYGSDYLMYAILDLVVDHYFEVLEELNTRMEHVEDVLMNGTQNGNFEDLHHLRRKMIHFRRGISPMSDVISTLIRDEHNLISEEASIYYRDIQDHLNRVIESLEHSIEISATLIETHMAQVNIRTGEVMKVLTIIATIFIPLTFIAGIYGMNFDPEVSPWNMPELNMYYGYPLSLTFMLMVSLGMLLYFRRRRWI